MQKIDNNEAPTRTKLELEISKVRGANRPVTNYRNLNMVS